jgi:hypothetical protein
LKKIISEMKDPYYRPKQALNKIDKGGWGDGRGVQRGNQRGRGKCRFCKSAPASRKDFQCLVFAPCPYGVPFASCGEAAIKKNTIRRMVNYSIQIPNIPSCFFL